MEEISPLQRLARVVQGRLGCSYSRAKEEVERGHVSLNGEGVVDPGALVLPTDVVLHDPHVPRRRHPQVSQPLEILYLDEHLLVVVKPAALLVHPTCAAEKDTLVTRAYAELRRRSPSPTPVLVVHRLDRDTSGVMVLARGHEVATALQRQFRAHRVGRRYLALVKGLSGNSRPWLGVLPARGGEGAGAYSAKRRANGPLPTSSPWSFSAAQPWWKLTSAPAAPTKCAFTWLP